MQRKVVFRVLWVLSLMMALALGCKVVDKANEVRQFVTEAQGIATEIDIGGAMTDVGGIATEMEGMVTEMGLEELFTDIPFFEEGTEIVATPAGFPTDIPIMADASEMSGTPTTINYVSDSDFNVVVDFYKREMVTQGWAEASGGTMGDGEATLVFQKGARQAKIDLYEDEFFGGVEIDIVITG